MFPDSSASKEYERLVRRNDQIDSLLYTSKRKLCLDNDNFDTNEEKFK